VSPCPHCGALAEVEPSAFHRWRCAVCGGPVVPADGVTRTPLTNAANATHAELANLVRAQRARAMGFGWTAGAVLFACIAVMAGGLGALLWGSSHTSTLVLAAVAGVAAVIALTSRGRASSRNRESRARLDEARQTVAEEVLRVRGGEVTAPELAKIMRLDVEQAETLLSGLSIGGQARVDVRDDAELLYRIAEPAPAPEAEVASLDAPAADREKAR
jgi:hypothetical protein